ncbi:uncharacterized protein V6R79_001919 [Siganus canaliculatus]
MLGNRGPMGSTQSDSLLVPISGSIKSYNGPYIGLSLRRQNVQPDQMLNGLRSLVERSHFTIRLIIIVQPADSPADVSLFISALLVFPLRLVVLDSRTNWLNKICDLVLFDVAFSSNIKPRLSFFQSKRTRPEFHVLGYSVTHTDLGMWLCMTLTVPWKGSTVNSLTPMTFNVSVRVEIKAPDEYSSLMLIAGEEEEDERDEEGRRSVSEEKTVKLRRVVINNADYNPRVTLAVPFLFDMCPSPFSSALERLRHELQLRALNQINGRGSKSVENNRGKREAATVDVPSCLGSRQQSHRSAAHVSPAICQGQPDQDGSPPKRSFVLSSSLSVPVHLYAYRSHSRTGAARYQSNATHFIPQCHVLSWPHFYNSSSCHYAASSTDVSTRLRFHCAAANQLLHPQREFAPIFMTSEEPCKFKCSHQKPTLVCCMSKVSCISLTLDMKVGGKDVDCNVGLLDVHFSVKRRLMHDLPNRLR